MCGFLLLLFFLFPFSTIVLVCIRILYGMDTFLQMGVTVYTHSLASVSKPQLAS